MKQSWSERLLSGMWLVPAIVLGFVLIGIGAGLIAMAGPPSFGFE